MKKDLKIEKIVIATRNPGKIERYSKLLIKVAGKVLSLRDFNFTDKPEEIGKTAEENAKIKALFYAGKTGLPVLAEDESLFVDFLPKNKQPGAEVRRINGKELTDDELLAHWDALIAPVPKKERTGRWHTAFCFATPEGKFNLTAIDDERLFFSPPSKVRITGWPMSSLQGPAEFGRPHSELTKEELKIFYRNRKILGELVKIIKD